MSDLIRFRTFMPASAPVLNMIMSFHEYITNKKTNVCVYIGPYIHLSSLSPERMPFQTNQTGAVMQLLRHLFGFQLNNMKLFGLRSYICCPPYTTT